MVEKKGEFNFNHFSQPQLTFEELPNDIIVEICSHLKKYTLVLMSTSPIFRRTLLSLPSHVLAYGKTIDERKEWLYFLAKRNHYELLHYYLSKWKMLKEFHNFGQNWPDDLFFSIVNQLKSELSEFAFHKTLCDAAVYLIEDRDFPKFSKICPLLGKCLGRFDEIAFNCLTFALFDEMKILEINVYDKKMWNKAYFRCISQYQEDKDLCFERLARIESKYYLFFNQHITKNPTEFERLDLVKSNDFAIFTKFSTIIDKDLVSFILENKSDNLYELVFHPGVRNQLFLAMESDFNSCLESVLSDTNICIRLIQHFENTPLYLPTIYCLCRRVITLQRFDYLRQSHPLSQYFSLLVDSYSLEIHACNSLDKYKFLETLPYISKRSLLHDFNNFGIFMYRSKKLKKTQGWYISPIIFYQFMEQFIEHTERTQCLEFLDIWKHQIPCRKHTPIIPDELKIDDLQDNLLLIYDAAQTLDYPNTHNISVFVRFLKLTMKSADDFQDTDMREKYFKSAYQIVVRLISIGHVEILGCFVYFGYASMLRQECFKLLDHFIIKRHFWNYRMRLYFEHCLKFPLTTAMLETIVNNYRSPKQ